MASETMTKLAKALAHPERETRVAGLDVVRTFLTRRKKSALEVDDLRKLWKGLFYCMWMCDKSGPQHELAEGLAAMVPLLTPREGLCFIEAFYATMAREWTGIDRLRLDKFYVLLRHMLGAAFRLLRDAHWDETLVRHLSDHVMAKIVLDPSHRVTVGLCLQVLDYWTVELSAVGCADAAVVSLLLQPVLLLLQACDNKVIVARIMSSLMDKLLDVPADAVAVDWAALAEHCLRVAGEPQTSQMNRSAFFELRKRIAVAHEPQQDDVRGDDEQAAHERQRKRPRVRASHHGLRDARAKRIESVAPASAPDATAEGSFVTGDGGALTLDGGTRENAAQFVTGSGKKIAAPPQKRRAKKRASVTFGTDTEVRLFSQQESPAEVSRRTSFTKPSARHQ